ncbi:MAG: GyrI-like domain-containing protein [Deltaproteobacteria bacterium]|nr:GyrI-like domain-containing protein [Deltaproteobacteria bacterium]MBW1930769.1 GyrI-like domain-containing protein [Deltaproteobacteria bacterium]MBW2024747.1 GyrI-like domain-containing protein [Deltaproteobacteria bacterium]MBW2125558.1 GyrI-like domain-containing protein [Deltaproteobacteria bacterium]
MEKIDFKKELKYLYKASAKEVSVVEVPPMNFLVIEGHGDPNTSSEYMEAIEAIYPVAYALKFKVKKSKGIDYVVMLLEGLWWTDDPAQFSMDNKEIWNWTAMIMQPEHVTKEMYEEAVAEVGKKKDLRALTKMRLETYEEGLSVQILHMGPYAEEGPTIARLHDYIKDHGYRFNGKHHEIYLSDPRKTAPEKLKTILRQPVTS